MSEAAKTSPYSSTAELAARVLLTVALSLAGLLVGFLSIFSADALGYLGIGFYLAGAMLAVSAMVLVMTVGRVRKPAIVSGIVLAVCACLLISNHLLLYTGGTVDQDLMDTQNYNETIDYDDYIPFDSDKIPRLNGASTLTFGVDETLPIMDSAAALLPLASGMYTACYPESVSVMGRLAGSEREEYERLEALLGDASSYANLSDADYERHYELMQLEEYGYADTGVRHATATDAQGLIRKTGLSTGGYLLRCAPFQYSNTQGGYENLANRVCDVMLGAKPSESQVEYARERGYELEYTPVGKEAFVFIVNKDNPVDSLTQDQVRAIYSGQITNWSQVGGNDEEIIAFQRNEGSGSQTQMERFMGDVPLGTGATTFRAASSMGGLVRSIAGYDNRGNGIGYSFRYYAASMVEGADVKILKIDGVCPDVSTISDGTYPLSSCFYAVTRKGELESNQNLARLVTWMQGPQGQELVEKAGYASLQGSER